MTCIGQQMGVARSNQDTESIPHGRVYHMYRCLQDESLQHVSCRGRVQATRDGGQNPLQGQCRGERGVTGREQQAVAQESPQVSQHLHEAGCSVGVSIREWREIQP